MLYKLKLKIFYIYFKFSLFVHWICQTFDRGFLLGYGFQLFIRFGFEASVVGFELALAFGCCFQSSYDFQLWLLLLLWAFGSLCDCVSRFSFLVTDSV